MRGDVYNGLGGALFLQICDLISEPTTAKEDKLKKLYKIIPDTDPGGYLGCFDSSKGSMLYNEYLLIRHAPGIIDSAVFVNRLFNIIHTVINQSNVNCDILAGIAGILIVSCRMHAVYPCRKTELTIKILTNKILTCANHHAENRVTWGRGWTGFSHGNAGTVYALTLANTIFHDKEIDKVIIKALRYENAFHISSGWNDISTYNTGNDFNAWCHGATGIYMSRIAMQKEMNSNNAEIKDIIRADIAHYNVTQQNRPPNTHLSLCHGIFGNAMIDPDRYGTHFDTSELNLNALEEKSLMLDKIGAIYANFYFSHDNIPNLLLLE